MEEEGWSGAKKVAPKYGPRVFWRRRNRERPEKVPSKTWPHGKMEEEEEE